MKFAVLAALLLAPLPAFAQSHGHGAGTEQGPLPQRAPNLANPQASANEQMQPPLARRNGNSGQADTIPTPALSQPMTPTNTGRPTR